MESFTSYLGCGFNKSYHSYTLFTVYNFTDIVEKIIPFFVQHPVLGIKQLNFNDWCEVANLIKVKKHLTSEGQAEILKIKKGINNNRI